MKIVNVEIGDRSYEIRIDSEWSFGEAVTEMSGRKGLIISDSNVGPIYAEKLQSALGAVGISAECFALEAGEQSKCLGNMERIYNAALDAGLDRKSVIIALGGGMAGDISGFAAATFMRGIGFIQVPTSLLAMVDSSVGGKTAVNLARGKNLAGSFYQPIEVDAALSTLATLPAREFSSGLAEVIKYGVIWDATFLSFLEANIEHIMIKNPKVMADVIARCCEIKSEVVAVDERESGVRGILNFGHTLGHSIENLCGYGGCLHGEAVSLGMVYALRVSVLQKDLDHAAEARVKGILKAAGLPVHFSDLKRNFTWDDLRRLMKSDKKTVNGVPRFVLAEKMGSVLFGCEVQEETLRGAYEALRAEEGE